MKYITEEFSHIFFFSGSDASFITIVESDEDR